MAVKVLRPEDLHPTSFEFKNGMVITKRKSISYPLNWAQGKNVINTANPVDYNNAERHRIQILNGIGKIHLDFKAIKDIPNGPLFSLPAGCPKPTDLIEVQTHDAGSIWVGANSGTIYATNLKKDTRYIVDILGFFNDV